MGEVIDSPHAWRQSDTANYIWDFYKNGIDLFHPSVCWMGGYKMVILEFPLVEAIVAGCYHLFGDSHVVARMVFFLFFLGSCVYFFKLVKFLSSQRTALYATIVYLFCPLSLFYSRAIHIDFAELFFAFGMAYHYMKGIREERLRHLFVGSIFAFLAFATKAPYALVFFLPLLVFILRERSFLYVLKRAYWFVIPVLLFALWQNHVFTVNDAAPDWDFIPGYRKFVHNAGWYYGSLEQRLIAENWFILKDRLLFEVSGIAGMILFLIGLCFVRKRLFITLWIIGTLLYLLVFFNLNVIHNYYQLPFVPIVSVVIGLTLTRIHEMKYWTPWVTIGLLVLLISENVWYAEENYYIIQPEREEIGDALRMSTEADDLVVINYHNFDSKCPNFLYAARRNGWMIPSWGMSADILYKLMLEGADYVAIIRPDEIEGDVKQSLSFYPQKVIQLNENTRMYLYETDVKYIWDIMPDEAKAHVREKLENAPD